MRTQVSARAKGNEKGNAQKAIYDLKHRVVLALNRLADRDTYQIGLGELEKTIECLNHDTVVPFMSCILDTDADQKSAVRKECIRLIGVLVTLHDGLIVPYLGKIVASIVKRLKDSDSIVRDACIETMGVLGSKLSNEEGENEDLFVALVKPLFEALGEQNKHTQSGAALCLARVIDYFSYPSISILQRMLTRIMQLLKNQHFMAKPAAVELTRSVIQAGGTPTKKALSMAVGSIQEALKNSDWNTRKAASLALLELASTGGPFIGSLKASCIRSLELCRFDKVKPVRDTILMSLNVWKSLPGPDTPEPSEAGSLIKENFCGGGDVFSSANGYEWKDSPLAKEVTESTKKMSPLSARKPRQSNLNNCQNPKAVEWHVEISVPKSHNFLASDINNEESAGSSITKSFGTLSTDIISCQENDHRYVSMVDKQECSSVSSLLTGNSKTKHVDVSKARIEGGMMRSVKLNHMFANDETDTEEERYPINSQDRRSTDSAVDSNSHNADRCILKVTKEMASIRKQLSEIESKQSDLMDMLKVFIASTTDSLSTIHSKVSCLEQVVDTLAQEVINGGRYENGNFLKISSGSGSPNLSKCTPRPSVDIRDRQTCVKNTFSRSKLSDTRKQETDIWIDPTIGKPKGNVNGRYNQIRTTHGGTRTNNDSVFGPASNIDSSHKNNLQKDCLFERDIESAYVEGLNLGDELLLFELVHKTGPVLDKLSRKTALDVLNILGSFSLEQKFINTIIPWLQQVVELSSIRGQNYLVPCAKTKQAFLSAIKQAASYNFTNSAERRFILQLAFELHRIWGGPIG